VVDDDFSRFLNILFAVSSGLAVLIAMGRLPEEDMMRGEFYALLLFSTAGASLFCQARDMVTVFIALETLSIPAYILAASHRADGRSTEAGFKYFILGAFSSGFLVYGIALLYGATGSTSYDAILAVAAKGWMNNPLLIAGALMVLVGMLFKIGAAPFHMWAPDVYQGSPTPATAFFATGVKAAAFAALARLLFQAIPSMVEAPGDVLGLGWYPLMQGIAILTMTAANLAALVQTDVKRILAYSSIAHAGYIFLGFLADADGVSAMLFYLVAYTFMTAGAFAIVAYFERLNGGTSLADYKGLGRKHPMTGAALSLFLFSLAGIPPTAGFFAKFYLFKSAVDVGLITLVVIAVVNSAVSAFYYLRIMVSMYMETAPNEQLSPKPSIAVSAVIVICVLFVVVLGLYPSPVLDIAIKSAASLF
jgi:NADH-quinone oxidoreductase subunit N